MSGETKTAGGEEKLWSSNLVILIVANFLSALGMYLLFAKITEYAYTEYNVAYSLAGLMLTVYVLAGLFTRLFLGGRIDAWGVKVSIVISAIINTVAGALYLIPMGFVPLLLVRILNGVGFAITTGANAAAAMIVVPASRRGEGIGYYAMAPALATGVGPFIAMAMTNSGMSFRSLFVVAFIMNVLALIMLTFFVKIPDVREKKPVGESGSHAPKKRMGIGDLIQLSVLPISAVMFLVYMTYGVIMAHLTMYSSEIGLVGPATFFFLVYSLVIVFTRPPAGRMVDTKGENKVVYAGLAVLAIGFALLAFANNGVLLLIAGGLIGFGIGIPHSAIQTVMSHMTPPTELGRANSTFYACLDLGSGISPVLIGFVIPLLGYRPSFGIMVVLAVVALVLYYFVHGRKYKPGYAMQKRAEEEALEAVEPAE